MLNAADYLTDGSVCLRYAHSVGAKIECCRSMRPAPREGTMRDRLPTATRWLSVVALAIVMLPIARLHAQAATATPVATSPATPFSVDVGTFYHDLDNGYSDWRGADVRLSWAGTRFSPF